MDDSTIRAAIKLIETRIAVLSKEDPTNNERVIREFENLRQSILKEKEKEKEDVDENLRQSILKEEDVDMDDQDDDEEDSLDELEKKLEKRIVVGVILDLLTYEEHESAFTPDMIDNPPDGDPMLLLSEDDLVFIRNSVEKLSGSSGYLWVTHAAFCREAKEWLEQHPHSNGDDSKITFLRNHFLEIISARDKKVNESRGRALARRRALLPSYDNNNPDTDTTDSDSNSEEEEEEKEKVPYIGKGQGRRIL